MLQWHPRLIALLTTGTIVAVAVIGAFARAPGWRW
jgi:hypothetical protein